MLRIDSAFCSFRTSDLIQFTYNAKKTRNQTFAVGKTAEVYVVYEQSSMVRQWVIAVEFVTRRRGSLNCIFLIIYETSSVACCLLQTLNLAATSDIKTTSFRRSHNNNIPKTKNAPTFTTNNNFACAACKSYLLQNNKNSYRYHSIKNATMQARHGTLLYRQVQ